jgi:hypothetical protein
MESLSTDQQSIPRSNLAEIENESGRHSGGGPV